MLSAPGTQAVIALLTDFGTHDHYVGVMKGVMVSRCPGARFLDITHEVSPQNVLQGAYLLRSAYRYFPAHTVFLTVVDPGVGTDRRPVAIKTAHGIFVGPDNGIFSLVLDEVEAWQAVVLWPLEGMSATFHGRDLFAPVAADLAGGRSIHELGTPTVSLVRSPAPPIERTGENILEGKIIHIDHFGNLISSLGLFDWQGDQVHLSINQPIIFGAQNATVIYKDREITGIRATYGISEPGELIAVINSDRHLEIAVNQGNAAALTGAQLGDTLQIHFRS